MGQPGKSAAAWRYRLGEGRHLVVIEMGRVELRLEPGDKGRHHVAAYEQVPVDVRREERVPLHVLDAAG